MIEFLILLYVSSALVCGGMAVLNGGLLEEFLLSRMIGLSARERDLISIASITIEISIPICNTVMAYCWIARGRLWKS